MKAMRLVSAIFLVIGFSFLAGLVPQPDRGHRGDVIRFYDEVWTKGNLAVIDEMVDPNYFRHSPTWQGTIAGPAALKDLVRRVRSSFSEYKVTLESMEGIGDKATIGWRLQGTYVGANREIQPGRRVDLSGTSVWTFKAGKILHEVVDFDEYEYHRQIEMAVPYEELKNRALVLSLLYELYGEGNLSAANELVTRDFILYDPGHEPIVGPDALKNRVATFRTAFPDLRFSIHEVVADGNRVTARWTLTGTHRGTWRGMPASGRRLIATGFTFAKVRDGKIAEAWSTWDRLAVTELLTD